MSEAQQYQKLRKYWKDKYRKAQRNQSIAMWEAKYAVPHPARIQDMRNLGHYGKVFVPRPENSIRRAIHLQQEASDYATMLNTWKIETSDKNIVDVISNIVPRIENHTVDKCEQLAVSGTKNYGTQLFEFLKTFRIIKWAIKATIPNIFRISFGKYTFEIGRYKHDNWN